MQSGFETHIGSPRYYPPFLARGVPPPEAMLEDVQQQDEKQKEPVQGEKIFCRHCLQLITSPAERIHIKGAHRHTFSNPAGLLFQIGCFRRAKGCAPASSPEAEWSWFRGYLWQVVLCSACGTHMGWRYRGSSDSFYGLILDRLVQGG